MTSRRRVRTLVIAGVAAGGAVAGHVLTYLFEAPDPHAGLGILAADGHGYWGVAVSLAVALGVVSIAAIALEHFRAGARGDGTLRPSVTGTTARLAATQLAVFVTMEIVERLIAGAPVSHLFAAGLLPLGLCLQVVVAWCAAMLVAVLARAAEIAGCLAGRRRVRRRSARPPVFSFCPRPSRERFLDAFRGRAPPRLAG